MKKTVFEFVRRGLTACGFGPMILTILYLILQRTAGLETLTVHEVCLGIVSLSVLAFIAGGMNILYQIEQLPLMAAILIHGAVLYAAYLATYLLNGWLEQGITHILLFTAIFLLGYLVVWIIIYSTTRRNTKALNQLLQEKQKKSDAR